MKIYQKRFIRVFIFIAIFLFPLLAVQESQDITDYEKRLADINRQIDELKRIISSEEKREASMLARLETAGLKKALTRKEISLFNTRLKKTSREIRTTQERILELRAELEEARKDIEKILVTLYKYGNISYLDLLFQVKNIQGLVSEHKHLSLLARSQDEILSDYIRMLDQLQEAEERLGSKREETRRLIAEEERKARTYASQEREYRNLIQKIETDKAAHQETLAELSERAKVLQSLIKRIVREGKPLSFSPVPLYESKGEVLWPVRGDVVSEYGEQIHPQFLTKTMNNGIEISSSSDVVVKAIHLARVAFADYFQGYGKLIILDHGLKCHSLYGHCSELLVDKGDVVDKGQPIAMVGDIGSLKGQSLYFEIRIRTEPVNPLQWLKRR